MGFSGALTTWSTFSLDLFDEISKKDSQGWMLNLFSSYVLGVGAAIVGFSIGVN
jgi:fluoride ion exporter CrcB/FEX